MENNLYCFVCGFKQEKEPWYDGVPSYEICPSCGIHFGYDDDFENLEIRKRIYKKWREKWTRNNMKWWSSGQSMPTNWNPTEQLKNIPQEFR